MIQCIQGYAGWPPPRFTNRGTALALGIFDGVHLGHQALLRTVLHWAEKEGLVAMACTFSPHPAKVLNAALAPLLLEPMTARLEHMGALGLQALIVQPFDKAFAATEAEDFVRQTLHGRLAVKHVVVGQDFVFGRRQGGTVALLQRLGSELGFRVHPIEPVRVQGMVASSTKVREFVQRGELRGAQAILGRAYRIYGTWSAAPQKRAAAAWRPWAIAAEQLPAPGFYAGWAVSPNNASHAPVLVQIVQADTTPRAQGCASASSRVLVWPLPHGDAPGGLAEKATYVALIARLEGPYLPPERPTTAPDARMQARAQELLGQSPEPNLRPSND